jgi:hypothetical protein
LNPSQKEDAAKSTHIGSINSTQTEIELKIKQSFFSNSVMNAMRGEDDWRIWG